MKTKWMFLLMIACCFCCSTKTFSQRTINREEFYVVNQNAFNKLKELPRRSEVIFQDFKDGKLLRTVNITNEKIPPDRERIITKTISDEKTTLVEAVRIGNESYMRENNGEWRKGFASGFGSGVGSGSTRQREKYTVVESIYKNESVKIYEQIVSDESRFAWEHSYLKKKIWINKNDLLLKVEFEHGFSEQNIVNRRVEEYVYDSNIKIEAPKLN